MLIGETPVTPLRGGPGEEEAEGLYKKLRHLETEEGRDRREQKMCHSITFKDALHSLQNTGSDACAI